MEGMGIIFGIILQKDLLKACMSMERLHQDYIDLINVHDIEFADLDQICQETLPALVELRNKGIVKHIGITNLTLRHFKYVIDHVPSGTVRRYFPLPLLP